MHRWLILAVAVALKCAMAGAAVAAPALKEVEKTDEPDWVLPAEVEIDQNGPGSGKGDAEYELVDTQVHLEEAAFYQRVVLKIHTAAGVEDFSQLNVAFQPEYQSLALHRMVVHRGGLADDRRGKVEVDVFRRERRLEQQLYDGRLTASIVLKDIRPGDTIEYAYTRKGRNPVLGGHVHEFYRLQFGRPMAWLKRRVIWNSAARSLRHRVIGGKAEPQELEAAEGMRELRWSAKNVPRLRTESSTPVWFEPYPWLEISDFASWGEVAAWARSQYPPGDLPQELQAVCAGFKQTAKSDEEAVVAALRWVKGNVRYLGSFFGEHTHKPYPLDEVLDRRFGDCKDKTTMLTAMLRHMGFDAAPALVNTDARHEVKDYLPGQAAFDHLIVHLVLGEADYWLDGTATFSRGPLKDLYTPAYGVALTVREKTMELSRVDPRGFNVDRVEVHETLDVPDMTGRMELRVETIATGAEANALRRSLATDSRDEIQQSYLEFYEADYPKIETASELRIEDEEEENRITVHEHYSVEEFWVPEEENSKVLECSLYARYLASDLNRPGKGARESPLAIQYPCNVRQTITVNLPEEWSLTPDDTEITNEAFEFRVKSELRKGKRQLKFTFDYRTLKDHVSADDFETYREAYDKLVDELSYYLTHEDEEGVESAESPDDEVMEWSLVLIFLGLAGFAGGIALAAGAYFWDPAPRAAALSGPAGLGGWLVFPTLGMLLTPLYLFFGTLMNLPQLDEDVNEKLTGELADSWGAVFGWTFLANLFLLPLSVILLVLFVQKRSSFPWFFLVIGVAYLLTDGVALLLVELLFDQGELGDHDLARSLLPPAAAFTVWALYILLSRRVRNTFQVTRLRRGPPALPPLSPG